jgi:UDP-GlcNAc:undecaprenyl-phosphate GlcNAc-1-phosphate transferase
MSLLILIIFFISLFALELIYFKIANHYNIIDHPNHRSSHTDVTIRGGGIIFSISLLLGAAYFGFEYGYFLIGLLLISVISFIDDIKPVSRRIRILSHLVAVALLFYQLGLFSDAVYLIFLSLFFVIGSINAINFMDGINGITGGYSFITLLTLYCINKYVLLFTNEIYLILPLIAVMVFNFFNFRIKAKCFAGDVGSVSIAFIILFFLLQLIIKTHNLNYILLLLVYGLDATITLLLRIYRKEKVVEPHRSHFYQFLVNEKGLSHLLVATLYTIVQGVINIVLITVAPTSILSLILSLAIGAIVFILVRLGLEGPQKLFNVNK